ncbi:MAG: hypothetical protein IKC83_02440, partial [Clostridia bacterium]|nr:hypothetical protein [Clostridia bacterium]
FILGDSYSTYEGYIPSGNKTFYASKVVDNRPVSKMRFKHVWWARLIKKQKYNLVLNDSWSGSTVCYTGYNGEDCSKTKAFIFRFRRLLKQGFFNQNKIDKVFVFGGTNDSWADAPLGQAIAENVEEKDLYSVLPAFCYLMNEIKQKINAQIYFIINTGLKNEISNCIKEQAKKLNVNVIELNEIDKQDGHPTKKGMKQIYKQVLASIKK